jgi:hypothetical protein
MKFIATGILSLTLLTGCKAVNATGTATAPTLTFAQGTNASLQAAHKFGLDVAASVQSGKLVLTPAQKQAFDAFAASLNATDAIYIAFESGTATTAQVAAALANTTALQTSAQTALGGQ